MRIIIIVLGLLTVSFGIAYYSMLQRVKEISKAFVQVLILNTTMREAFETTMQSPVTKEDQDIHKENFIKFLSDSRDWAYEYIEDVQSGLNKFVSSVDADIAYFDEYGDVLSVERPDYAAMKNISVAYKELKKLLPVEEKQ